MSCSKNLCCLILNYNDADTTIKLVNRIKMYSILDYILVVDNHSNDDSLSKLKKIMDSKVVVIATEENGGYGSGNNFGIKFAYNILKCQYVLLSNPDVIFEESLILKMLEAFRLDEDIALVSAIQYDLYRNPIKDFAWKVPDTLDYMLMATRFGRIFDRTSYAYQEIINNQFNYVECVPGALLLYDSKKFLLVDGYDEEMFLFGEETTIGYKFKRAGYKTILLGKEKYIHEHSVSINKSIKSKRKQVQLTFDNRLLFMKKYLKSNKVCLFIVKKLQERWLNKMK